MYCAGGSLVPPFSCLQAGAVVATCLVWYGMQAPVLEPSQSKAERPTEGGSTASMQSGKHVWSQCVYLPPWYPSSRQSIPDLSWSPKLTKPHIFCAKQNLHVKMQSISQSYTINGRAKKKELPTCHPRQRKVHGTVPRSCFSGAWMCTPSERNIGGWPSSRFYKGAVWAQQIDPLIDRNGWKHPAATSVHLPSFWKDCVGPTYKCIYIYICIWATCNTSYVSLLT